MIAVLKDIWKIFDKNLKYQFLLLFLSVILLVFLEVISIGLVFPLTKILLTNNYEIISGKFFPLDKFFNLEGLFELKTTLVLLFLVFFIFKIFFYLYLQFFITNFSHKFNVYISSILFKGYSTLDYQKLKSNYSSSEIIRNVINESKNFYSFLYHFIIFLNEILVLFFILVLLFFINSLIVISMVLITVLYLYIFSNIFKKKIENYGIVRLKFSEDIIKIIQETFYNFEFLKISNKKVKLFNDFYKKNFTLNKINRNFRFINFLPRSFFELLIVSIFLISILYFMNKKIPTETILSTLAVFGAAAIRIIPSITKIISSQNIISYNVYSSKLVIKELKKLPKILEYKNQIFDKIRYSYNLEIKSLYYNYTNSKKNIISNLNLQIKKKTLVVVSGESGSGKSTLLRLILGLLKIKKGGIFIDGKKIETQNQNYQNILGYVPQNIFLLNDTIKNNILFNRKISKKKYYKIINMSGLKTFVQSKSNNFTIGENGINISGGEKQRIGIARALVNSPEILLLDEPMSALDEENQQMILKTIKNLSRIKTIFLVTHDPKKIKFNHQSIKLKI